MSQMALKSEMSIYSILCMSKGRDMNVDMNNEKEE
jgi:hypothetical protein